MKRIFDFLVALFGLIITSPIFAVVAIGIKITSPGPVYYRAKRTGKSGKPFTMYKFRTMVVNADKMGGPSTASDDPRLTKIGLFLKKFQLDELPQLINILKGEMSLVGPRPEVEMYTSMFTAEEKKILTVPPGMTDYASLWDFHEGELLKGSDDPEKTYMEKVRPKKIELQLKYVKEHTFWIDLKIIVKTVLKIFA
jgi:lipopolysaccharide/colanic/teichoic acid biosynthesis glycosyltransferase